MTIHSGLVFVGGYTARSQAYLQAIGKARITLEKVILYGNPEGTRPGQVNSVSSPHNQITDWGFAFPDLSENPTHTANIHGWDFCELSNSSVNDLDVVKQLKSSKPKVMIFSGYGGEIVASETLKVAPLLHVHAGSLPGQRGSTTMYYSWLAGKRIGVTSLLLDVGLDTGQIPKQSSFLPPPKGDYPNYEYDTGIRATVLVETLRQYGPDFDFPRWTQTDSCNPIFYVIHPVLKHIPLISR